MLTLIKLKPFWYLHRRFKAFFNNVFNENISAWLTMGGLKGKGIQSVFPSDYQLMPFTATNPQISPLGYR